MGSKGLQAGYAISLFSASGSADGWCGDHFLLAPPYTVTAADVEEIVNRVGRVVDAVFEDLGGKSKAINRSTGVDGCDGVNGVDGRHGVGH